MRALLADPSGKIVFDNFLGIGGPVDKKLCKVYNDARAQRMCLRALWMYVAKRSLDLSKCARMEKVAIVLMVGIISRKA